MANNNVPQRAVLHLAGPGIANQITDGWQRAINQAFIDYHARFSSLVQHVLDQQCLYGVLDVFVGLYEANEAVRSAMIQASTGSGNPEVFVYARTINEVTDQDWDSLLVSPRPVRAVKELIARSAITITCWQYAIDLLKMSVEDITAPPRRVSLLATAAKRAALALGEFRLTMQSHVGIGTVDNEARGAIDTLRDDMSRMEAAARGQPVRYTGLPDPRRTVMLAVSGTGSFDHLEEDSYDPSRPLAPNRAPGTNFRFGSGLAMVQSHGRIMASLGRILSAVDHNAGAAGRPHRSAAQTATRQRADADEMVRSLGWLAYHAGRLGDFHAPIRARQRAEMQVLNALLIGLGKQVIALDLWA